MAAPFFSIITASYNYGQTIAATLESVRCQNFAENEHIVIDGGSTDETLDVLSKFESSYNLVWISESDKGISNALNKGIARANGKYVLVLQADDCLVSPQTLMDAYNILANHSYDIYSCPIIYQDERGMIRIFKPRRCHKIYYRFKNCFRSQGTFIRRTLFDAIGQFREEYEINMDYDFYYRAMQASCKVKLGFSPISLMGRDGVSSRPQNMEKRILEEFQVQRYREHSLFWRTIQGVYRPIYWFYKV